MDILIHHIIIKLAPEKIAIFISQQTYVYQFGKKKNSPSKNLRHRWLDDFTGKSSLTFKG